MVQKDDNGAQKVVSANDKKFVHGLKTYTKAIEMRKDQLRFGFRKVEVRKRMTCDRWANRYALQCNMDAMKRCGQGKLLHDMNNWLKLRMVLTRNENRFERGCNTMVWSENQDLQTHNQTAVCYA